MHNSNVKGNIILLISAVIWGSAFVAQRIGADFLGPFQFNGLRFILAAVILLPIARKYFIPINKKEKKGLFLIGSALFLGSAFQQAGLGHTSAGNAGFITGLYVIIVPIIMRLYLQKKLSWLKWLGAVLAFGGMFLLSVQPDFTFAYGDILVLIGALFWAVHVILIAKVVKSVPVMMLAIGQFLICGVLNLGFAWFFESTTMQSVYSALPAILYTGIFSVAIGFTLQVWGQKFTTPTSAAIILSLEALFAFILGYLFLNELVTMQKIMGATLMLLAMILAQITPSKKRRISSKIGKA